MSFALFCLAGAVLACWSDRWGWWRADAAISWMLVTLAPVNAVAALAEWDVPRAAVWAATAGIYAYRLWKHRRPRQRKPSRVAGTVRDLGHRLTVVPS